MFRKRRQPRLTDRHDAVAQPWQLAATRMGNVALMRSVP
jgi:hypothetical protein